MFSELPENKLTNDRQGTQREDKLQLLGVIIVDRLGKPTHYIGI